MFQNHVIKHKGTKKNWKYSFFHRKKWPQISGFVIFAMNMRKLKVYMRLLGGLLHCACCAAFPHKGWLATMPVPSEKSLVVADSILDYMFSASIYLHEVKGIQGRFVFEKVIWKYKAKTGLSSMCLPCSFLEGYKWLFSWVYQWAATYGSHLRLEGRGNIYHDFPQHQRVPYFDTMDYMKFNIYAPSLMGKQDTFTVEQKGSGTLSLFAWKVEHRLGENCIAFVSYPCYRARSWWKVFCGHQPTWTIRRMNLADVMTW